MKMTYKAPVCKVCEIQATDLMATSSDINFGSKITSGDGEVYGDVKESSDTDIWSIW